MRLSKKDATTSDSDITKRRWLPVDVDPVRPSGVSSSEEEHHAAIERAQRIASYLAEERGWPSPIVADSGNGAHLLYRVDLPNDSESRMLVKRVLEVLDTFFSDHVCTIDTSNDNAARIWKLYGTVSRKGDNTSVRPWRRSRILDAPEPIRTVDHRLLAELAASLPMPEEIPVPRGRGPDSHGRLIDLGAWLLSHGIGIASERPYMGGTLFTLEECPFSDAHRDGAFAIQFASGALLQGATTTRAAEVRKGGRTFVRCTRATHRPARRVGSPYLAEM